MQNWQNMFRPHILERGREYYLEGVVTELEEIEQGYFHAIVEGNEEYEVGIAFSNNEVDYMECSCPYAGEGNNCKHMAAVLFEIFDNNDTSHESNSKSTGNQLDETINNMNINELREFIKDVALSDKKIKNQLLVNYSKTIDEIFIQNLKDEIDYIVDSHQDRYSFIDYNNAFDFAIELNYFINTKVYSLIEKDKMKAFGIINYVFEVIGNLEIDDSGEISDLGDECYNVWEIILERCNEAEKEIMYNWFSQHKTGGFVIDYMEDYMDKFIMNEFHDEIYLKLNLSTLDAEIRQFMASHDMSDSWNKYQCQGNIMKRIEIMKELKYSIDEIKAYRKANWQFSDVRKQEISESIEANDVKHAIKVLKESRQIDKNERRLVDEYSKQLIELYSQDSEEYENELLFYVYSCQQNNLDYIIRLKQISTVDEWKQHLNKLLQSESCNSVHFELLKSEGMYEQMLQDIIKEKSIYLLNQYEAVLKDKYPEQVRDCYISYVNDEMKIASDRSRYQQLIRYLSRIAKYPDGEKTVNWIAETWKYEYKRRRAMLDELEKAGF